MEFLKRKHFGVFQTQVIYLYCVVNGVTCEFHYSPLVRFWKSHIIDSSQQRIRWNCKTTKYYLWRGFWISSSFECWGEEIICPTPILSIQIDILISCCALNLWSSQRSPRPLILSPLVSIPKAMESKTPFIRKYSVVL